MENPDIDSVNPESKPSTPPAETPRNSDLIPEIPPPIQSKKETTHCKPDQTPLWKMLLETAAVFVGLYVAGVYHGQLVVMQGQLGEIIKQSPEIQKSADAAKSAADTADATLKSQQKSFEIDQRPYVVSQLPIFSTPPGFVANADLFVNLTFKNIGRTPALKDWTDTQFVAYYRKAGAMPELHRRYREFLDGIFQEFRRHEIKDREASAPFPALESDIAPGGDYFVSNQKGVELSGDQLELVKKGDAGALFFLAMTTYSDSFGSKYETTVCWYYVGTHPEIWHRCDSYNAIK
jgi:hypothetical protein